MKKLLAGMGILLLGMIAPIKPLQAQDPILAIIQAGVIKVIKAVDLKFSDYKLKPFGYKMLKKS